jgi:dephospho-CoA kinase
LIWRPEILGMTPNKMHFIGLTGGVGSGKSVCLRYLSDKYNAAVLSTDDLARKLSDAGEPVNEKIHERFRDYDVFLPDGNMDRPAMAKLIMNDRDLRTALDDIIHPAVIEKIMGLRDILEADGREFFFVESAILIESGFFRNVDESWLVYAPVEIRRARLKETRGYSDQRIDAMLKAQLSYDDYLKYCSEVIKNGGSVEEMQESVDRAIEHLRRSK